MGKLLKIIIWIAVLALVYLSIGTLFKSCNSVSDGLDSTVDVIENTVEDVSDQVTDVGEVEYFEDNEELDYTTEEVIEEEIIEEEIIDEPVEEKPRYTNTGSSSGQYMLICGNYLVETNGNEMIKKLRKLGYNSAELVVFDNSQYHTVISSRYSSYNEALRAESALKAKGIDCYVKLRS